MLCFHGNMLLFYIVWIKENREHKQGLVQALKGYLFVLAEFSFNKFPFAHEINEDVFIHL